MTNSRRFSAMHSALHVDKINILYNYFFMCVHACVRVCVAHAELFLPLTSPQVGCEPTFQELLSQAVKEGAPH